VSPEQILSSLLFFYGFWLGASLISAYFLETHTCAEELFLTREDGFRMFFLLNVGMSQLVLNARYLYRLFWGECARSDYLCK